MHPGGACACSWHYPTWPISFLRRNSLDSQAKASSLVEPSLLPCSSPRKPRELCGWTQRPRDLASAEGWRGTTTHQAWGNERGQRQTLLGWHSGALGGCSNHHSVPTDHLLHDASQPSSSHCDRHFQADQNTQRAGRKGASLLSGRRGRVLWFGTCDLNVSKSGGSVET